jgi:CheY-like chemotaxis protein
MGGTMWAESAGAGKGSTFFVTIRARPAELPPNTRREFIGAQPALAGKRLLIVDDNHTNRKVLTLQTAKWGMVPRDTASPKEALLWLKEGMAFDLAILDTCRNGRRRSSPSGSSERDRAAARLFSSLAGAGQQQRRSAVRRLRSRCDSRSTPTADDAARAGRAPRPAAPAKPALDAGMAARHPRASCSPGTA